MPSVSRSIQIVAILVFAVILGVTAQQLAQLRATTLEETHRQMARLDMVLAEQTGRAMDTIDFILRNVIEQSGAGQGAAAISRDTLRRRITGVRQLLAIDIADPDGQIRVTSRAAADGALPPAGGALLARHAQDAKAGLLFSEPIRQADGSWTALVTRRIDGADQRFAGIAAAWLNLAYFEDFYKSVELAENGSIILHRRDGIVLARYPHDERLIGTSYGALPPFRDVLSHDIAGTLEMDSPLDHSRRILAIRALRAFPLAVNVSVDEAGVLASWRQQTWTFTFGALGAAMIVAALLLLLARRSRDVERLLGQSFRAHDSAEAARRDLLVQMDERERAETALRHAQRVEAVGQLTGGVAHDFNNLLTVLLGNIELLQSQPEAAPFAARLATMRAAAERGATLTGHLLAFARRQPLMPRAVDLGVLIRGMQPLLQSAVGSQISLILDLDAQTPAALVDPTQMELVILNLAINARDAMPGGGSLVLSTCSEALPSSTGSDAPPAGDYVRLRVQDTGTGMAADVLGRAFEPYFTTKPIGAGSGLGLSQVYGVARQSGGLARIASTQGAGTTVDVLLPRAAAADLAAAPVAAAVRPVTEGRAHLLVVDDDADVRVTTAQLLRRFGYRVTEAMDAASALRILREVSDIELLLTDVVMPHTSGPELARQALNLQPDLAVVFFSGYTDPASTANGVPLERLLRKPFRPAELAGLIEDSLTAARSASRKLGVA